MIRPTATSLAPPGSPAAPVVRSGQVVALRLFDLAFAIDLKRAGEEWLRQGQRGGGRGRLAGTPPKAVSFGVPPLVLDMDPVTLELDGLARTAEVRVRLYEFGIAAFALRLPVADLAWPGFVGLVNEADRALGWAAAAPVWARLLADLRKRLEGALLRPVAAPLQEDYLLAVVDAFDEPLSAEAVLERVDLVPLLAGESRPLAEGARRDLLRQRFSYFADDLVVLTWDRAFIHEPRRETDVADVLEVANAQLLEMRYYDELLDAELPRMYDMVEASRATARPFAARRYGRLARRLHTLVAEVTEVTEKVDNALQVTEDVYLARVYAAAIDLFRVPNVNAAVDRKLAIVRDTYTALYSEAHGARAELMEVAVILLIALEVVLSVWHSVRG